MARPKGQPKIGGRVKGTPNKIPKALKEMILGALEAAGNALDPENPGGGQAYLQAQATANPGPFLTLIGKVLPMDVHLGDPEGKPLVINILPVKPID